jgi:hypothetical protein
VNRSSHGLPFGDLLGTIFSIEASIFPLPLSLSEYLIAAVHPCAIISTSGNAVVGIENIYRGFLLSAANAHRNS